MDIESLLKQGDQLVQECISLLSGIDLYSEEYRAKYIDDLKDSMSTLVSHIEYVLQDLRLAASREEWYKVLTLLMEWKAQSVLLHDYSQHFLEASAVSKKSCDDTQDTP